MNLLLIPLLPLLSFAALITIGRRLGRWSPGVSLLALGGSAYLSILQFWILWTRPVRDNALAFEPYVRLAWNWLPFGEHPIRLGLLADPLSITMCLVVTIVGWLIMLYSIGYMAEDPRFSRFFAYLSLFFSAMLTLVLADNLLLLYIGWEGVGLCSYLLISFWFEKESAAKAGKKAFLTTRVGDVGLFIGLLLIAKVTGDLSFTDLSGKAQLLTDALGKWAWVPALLIFWGACGKSAQFPLHVWLPDAMEGPTPVSALIHAATMVAAGVYLVARTLPLFLPSPEALFTVAVIGGLTSFFAATIACAQTDLKRILAYSTISQLGLMMLGLGCGSATASMFHLVTHAWFKALLFLGAGSVIHALHHQEITRMGGLWNRMPITAVTFTIASIAMAGIPPFSGFWSKEEILRGTLSLAYPAPVHGLFFPLALSVSMLTAFYITRATILTFFGRPKGARSETWRPPHESPLVMTGPLLLLSLGAIGIGWIGSPWAGHWLSQFLKDTSVHHLLVGAYGLLAAEISPSARWAGLPLVSILENLAGVSVLVAATGIGLAVLRYGFGIPLMPAPLRRTLAPLYRFVANKYYIDELYEAVIIRPLSRLVQKAFDFDANVVDGAVNQTGMFGLALSRFKGWVDQVIVDGLVNGFAATVGQAGVVLRGIQTGLVQNYLLIAFSGAAVLFLMLRWLY